MHYRNGREAREGDAVLVKSGAQVIAGRIHSLVPGSTSCNGQVAMPIMGGVSSWCVTVGECLHVEDAWAAFDKTQQSVTDVGPAS